jgi:hypothetical protein
MNRRKYLATLGSLAAGGAAAVGTGAFTSVSADRQVSVQVAGDDAALLALEPCDDPNGDYASIDDGQFTLDIPNLNGTAFTRIDNVFRVTNQGTQPVVLYIEEDGANTVVADIGVKASELDRGPESEGTNGNGIAGDDVFDVSDPGKPGWSEIGIKIDEGQSIKLGVYVDTSDENVNDGLSEYDDGSPLTGNKAIWDSLTIYADANQVGNHEYTESGSV